jgi:hypothetical protein
MDAGDFAAACPLLERSQAADASSGTLLNLGDCYEHVGRTASADRAFAEALELAQRTSRPDRVQVAELRRSRLAPRLRRLRILAPTKPVENLKVSVDDEPLPALGEPIAVDPGTHAVRASAVGFSDYVTQVPAPDVGASVDVPLPELQPLQAASATPGDAQPAAHSLDGREVAALTCGAIGVVGVVSGTVFGLRSISKHDESDKYCDGSACTDQRGVDAMDSARSAGTLSTVSFIVGGVGLGAAAVLWFAMPKARDGVSAELGVGPAALELRGRF